MNLFTLLRRSFWGLFGAIWLVAGVMFILIGIVQVIRDGMAAFPIVGVVIAAVGGVLLRRGLVEVSRELRLQRTGTPAEATVTAVTETNFRYNRERQWVVHYRYVDRDGRTHEGKSGYLSPDEAAEWEEGQTVAIRFDPVRPSESIWIGASRE